MKNSVGVSLANPGTDEAIEDQLELLVHAVSCKVGDEQTGARCREPRCFKMRKILEHLKICDLGECCAIEGCFATRQLDKHFKKCFSAECHPCRTVSQRLRFDKPISPPKPVDPITGKWQVRKQLLEFALHIHKCRSLIPKVLRDKCGLRNCEALERSLLHVYICEDKQICPYPSCVATRFVLSHWRPCEPDLVPCLVCEPHCQPNNQPTGYDFKPRQRYFVAQHIEQLYHLATCLLQDQNNPQNKSSCPRGNCKRMKELIEHLPLCTNERCPEPQCRSSKRILKHIQLCFHPDCPCCNPKEVKDDPKVPIRTTSVSGVPPLPKVYPLGYNMKPLEYAADQLQYLRRLLVFLLHAHKCASKSVRDGTLLKTFPCRFEHCQSHLELYHHMLDCENYEHCASKDQCSLARKIIHHWQTCDEDECAMCFPLSEAIRGSKQSETPQDAYGRDKGLERDEEMEQDG